MRKLYETPEILITRFDVNKRVMVELETGNQKPGDIWDAGVGGPSDQDPGSDNLGLLD